MTPYRDPLERFWEKVTKGEQGDCWPWIAGSTFGYGIFGFKGKTVKAHRFSYEIYFGKIPEGMVIDHICHNRACVNPRHLRCCRPVDNVRNQNLTARNTSGVKGACWDPKNKKWKVCIRFEKKKIFIGRFADIEQAGAAYREAAIKYHGEFANFGEAS